MPNHRQLGLQMTELGGKHGAAFRFCPLETAASMVFEILLISIGASETYLWFDCEMLFVLVLSFVTKFESDPREPREKSNFLDGFCLPSEFFDFDLSGQTIISVSV